MLVLSLHKDYINTTPICHKFFLSSLCSVDVVLDITLHAHCELIYKEIRAQRDMCVVFDDNSIGQNK